MILCELLPLENKNFSSFCGVVSDIPKASRSFSLPVSNDQSNSSQCICEGFWSICPLLCWLLSPNASSENDLACDDGKVNQCFIDVSMLTDFVSDKLVNGYYV